jgi:hypothetical protein
MGGAKNTTPLTTTKSQLTSSASSEHDAHVGHWGRTVPIPTQATAATLTALAQRQTSTGERQRRLIFRSGFKYGFQGPPHATAGLWERWSLWAV